MTLLFVALALLLLPASVAGAIPRAPSLASLLDGISVGTILGLVALVILPDATATAGMWALVAAAGGMALPRAAERVGVSIGAVHAASALAGLAALMLHASLDGVALAAAARGAPALGVSVAVHQVPVGLAVYTSQHRRAGRMVATLALVGMALVTVAGFFLGDRLLAAVDGFGIGVFQGLAAGSIAHMVGHEPIPGGDRHRHAAGLGAAAAVALLLLAPHAAHEGHEGEHGAYARELLSSLASTVSPALLVATALRAAGGVLPGRIGDAWRGLERHLHPLAASIVLLGPLFTAVRWAGSALLGRVLRLGGPPDLPPGLSGALSFGPSLVQGLVFASLLAAAAPENLAHLPAWQVVLGAAILGAGMRLDAIAAALVASALAHVGAPPSAALAFTWASWGRHRRSSAWEHVVVLAPLAFVMGLSTELAPISLAAPPFLTGPVPELCALGLAGALLVSLVLQGPRAWLASLEPPRTAHDAHTHDHQDHAHA